MNILHFTLLATFALIACKPRDSASETQAVPATGTAGSPTDIPTILKTTAHRPYPLNTGEWNLEQDWENLLYLHWVVPNDEMRKIVPPQFEVDTYEGKSYVGMVVMGNIGIKHRYLPELSFTSNFPEVNLRVYVKHHGRPGIMFLKIYAHNNLVAKMIRTLGGPPYVGAIVELHRHEKISMVRAEGTGPDKPFFNVGYQPGGEAAFAKYDPKLIQFLGERYAAYVVSSKGAVSYFDVHHVPLNILPADARVYGNNLLKIEGLSVDGTKPDMIFRMPYVKSIFWPAVKVP